MSSTNKTTYYELSQYVGTDIINPLTDFNGDNEKIDTALHNIAEAAGTSAADITALAGRVTTEEGKVSALETQNGSDVLVTTAQTLSGAINELKSVNDTQSSTLSAHTSSIDNLASRMTSAETDISAVETDISAVETALNDKYLLEADVNLVETYTSTDTYKNIIIDAATRFKSYIQNLADDEYVEISGFKFGNYIFTPLAINNKLFGKNATDAELYFDGNGVIITTSNFRIEQVGISFSNYSASAIFAWTVDASGATFANLSDGTTSNFDAGFEVRKYKKVG